MALVRMTIAAFITLRAFQLSAEECQFSSAPAERTLTQKSWLRIWDGQDQRVLDAPVTTAPPLVAKYRAEVSSAIQIDQIFLLKRQRELFEKAFGSAGSRGYDLILKKGLGELHSPTCLEQLLMQSQLEKQVSLLAETEFHAAVLQRGDDLKIYQLVSQFVSPPELGIIKEDIKADIKAGWQLTAHIHNHPFFLSNLPDGDVAGTVIPSGTVNGGADLNTFADLKTEFGLRQATITNGFDTLKLDAEEFHLFLPPGHIAE